MLLWFLDHTGIPASFLIVLARTPELRILAMPELWDLNSGCGGGRFANNLKLGVYVPTRKRSPECHNASR